MLFDLKKLDSFILETSKNHLIHNFLRNGRVRVKNYSDTEFQNKLIVIDFSYYINGHHVISIFHYKMKSEVFSYKELLLARESDFGIIIFS